MLTRLTLAICAAILTFSLAACDTPPESSDRKMNRQQEQLSNEAASEVGLPAITNFQEKRMMKMILELRDQTIATVTYISDLNGHLHKICDSAGYGLPYATQFTNPMKVAGGFNTPSTGNVAVPQADPNGLFSPASADGTWVMCLDPAVKKLKPVYIEPHVIVSPFSLAVE
jgi:hypothetical protein